MGDVKRKTAAEVVETLDQPFRSRAVGFPYERGFEIDGCIGFGGRVQHLALHDAVCCIRVNFGIDDELTVPEQGRG